MQHCLQHRLTWPQCTLAGHESSASLRDMHRAQHGSIYDKEKIQKPDIINSEDKESEEAANQNQHEDAERYKAYKMSTGHFKRNGWTNPYLFFMTRPRCASFKRSHLERRFKTAHPKFNESYPPGSELRGRISAQFTASLFEQQNLIHRTTSTAERLTEASFEIAWIWARAKKTPKKTFSDSEIVKDSFSGFTTNVIHRLWP